jgi:adenylate cyclase
VSSFIKELQDRKVIRIGLVYLIGGWILMQVADVMFPALGLPAWTITLVAALLIIGFPLALVLAWAYDATPDGIKRASAPDERAVADEPDSAAAAAAAGSTSVAVLPFVDMSPERDNEYFSDGLTEELLNVLAAVPDLRVSSRTSCFTFKGKDADIPTVAQKLKVAHVLEGSVRKAGNRVRITAQLIDAASDKHLWSATYDRELENIFEIQDDIARQIAQALKVHLDPEHTPGATTSSAGAYDLYLRGRSFYRKFSMRDLRFAIEMFQKATEADPRFARAWCGIADSHSLLALYLGTGSSDTTRADEASGKAVTLAPYLAEAYVSRGLFHLASEQIAEAEAGFLRAIELDPHMPEPFYQLGRTCILKNDLRAAVGWFDKATRLSPDDFEIPLIAGPIHRSLGDDARAIAEQRRGLENARRHLDVHPDSGRAYYLGAGALYTLGALEEADAWAERALAIDPTDGSTLYNVACYYAQCGQVEKAFDCLSRGGIHSVAWMEHDPDLEPLRADPRFDELLRKYRSLK